MLTAWWLGCATHLPPSYADAPSWAELSRQLPAEVLPAAEDEVPDETWWSWRESVPGGGAVGGWGACRRASTPRIDPCDAIEWAPILEGGWQVATTSASCSS